MNNYEFVLGENVHERFFFARHDDNPPSTDNGCGEMNSDRHDSSSSRNSNCTFINKNHQSEQTCKCSSRAHFFPDQLVWVCMSKGLKKKSKKNGTKLVNCSKDKATTTTHTAALSHHDDDHHKEYENDGEEKKGRRMNQHQQKGQQYHHQQRMELFYPARVIQIRSGGGYGTDEDDKATSREEHHHHQQQQQIVPLQDRHQQHQQNQLRQRHVPRIQVQYPRGSTYWCHEHQLIPVLEPSGHYQTNNQENHHIHHNNSSCNNSVNDSNQQNQQRDHKKQHHNHHIVCVYAETCDYRRACVVHGTIPYEIFFEIGCAVGITIQRVYQGKLKYHHQHQCYHDHHSPPLPQHQSNMSSSITKSIYHSQHQQQHPQSQHDENHSIRVVGIDKSKECIQMARIRCRNMNTSMGTRTIENTKSDLPVVSLPKFIHSDIFTDPWDQWWPPSENTDDDEKPMISKEAMPTQTTTLLPHVVAIDLNGTREVDTVLQAIQMIIQQWGPRLILVKSRQLHSKISSSELCILFNEQLVI